MNEIIVKIANSDVYSELNSIGFDSEYINTAKNKYQGKLYKIYNLKPHEANILKQTCLSLGFDCAVSRDTVMCKCETTDAIIFASNSQLKMLVQKLEQQPFRLSKLSSLINEVIKGAGKCLTILSFKD